jgi:imidazoleglycerol phosphate synthase glutamine amidotransferase subunit HisH
VHDLINDAQTINDAVARDKNVKEALGIYLGHQLWEKRAKEVNGTARTRIIANLGRSVMLCSGQ